jgi:hypothetical protein
MDCVCLSSPIITTKGTLMTIFSAALTFVLVAFLSASTLLGQACVNCPDTTQNCTAFTLSCSNCGFSRCSAGGPENSTSTPTLNTCRSSVSLTCRAARDSNNNLIVCGNASTVQQCFQREIVTSGYRCSDGVFTTYTATPCCNA